MPLAVTLQIDAKKESELRKVASKIMHKKKKEKPKVQSQTSSKEPPVLKPPSTVYSLASRSPVSSLTLHLRVLGAKAAKEASKPAKKGSCQNWIFCSLLSFHWSAT